MSTGDKDEGLLGRWAKRKAEVQKEAALTEDALVEDEVLEEAEPAEPETEEAALEVLRERDPELAEKIAGIDVDKLEYEDDFSIFMNEKVPEFLRRRALSKLWLSSPILANVDGLNDYDDDFTDAGSVLKDLKSAYETAKGDEVEEGGSNEVPEDCIVEDQEAPDGEAHEVAGASEAPDGNSDVEDSEAV